MNLREIPLEEFKIKPEDLIHFYKPGTPIEELRAAEHQAHQDLFVIMVLCVAAGPDYRDACVLYHDEFERLTNAGFYSGRVGVAHIVADSWEDGCRLYLELFKDFGKPFYAPPAGFLQATITDRRQL